MSKEEYYKIRDNEKLYKLQYYCKIIFSIIIVISLLSLSIVLNNDWFLLFFFIMLFYFVYKLFYNKSIYEQYLSIKRFNLIEGIEDNDYLFEVINRLERQKYKIEQVNQQFYKAKKRSRIYAIFDIGVNIEDLDIKKEYSLSKKLKLFELNRRKPNDELYNIINIIIANKFGEEIKDIFQFDGFQYRPKKELFIGVEKSSGKIYMNYGYNNVNSNFSKELYFIITGMKKDN